MRLNGEQIGRLQEVLVNAFPSQPDLAAMVRIKLDKHLSQITGGENLEQIVFRLIEWAEINGKLEELIRKAHEYRPGNEELKKFVDNFKGLDRKLHLNNRQSLTFTYTNPKGETIVIVQTWPERPEWGSSYHTTNPTRILHGVLKLFGNETRPVPDDVISQCIQNAINIINEINPDIIGLGGQGRHAKRIHIELKEAGCRAKIEYWGGDVGIDAEQFLQSYQVDHIY